MNQKSGPEHHHFTFFAVPETIISKISLISTRSSPPTAGSARTQSVRHATPRVSGRPECQPDASWQFRRPAFSRSKRLKLGPEPAVSRSKRLKLVPEPRIFTLDGGARSGARADFSLCRGTYLPTYLLQLWWAEMAFIHAQFKLKRENLGSWHYLTKCALENKLLNQNVRSWYHFSQEKLPHTLIPVIASTLWKVCRSVFFFLGHPVYRRYCHALYKLLLNIHNSTQLKRSALLNCQYLHLFYDDDDDEHDECR